MALPVTVPDDKLAAMQAELTELRKDKARLDWLDSGGVWKMEKRFYAKHGAHWPVFFTPTFGWESYGHDTARKAIDWAMKDRCR